MTTKTNLHKHEYLYNIFKILDVYYNLDWPPKQVNGCLYFGGMATVDWQSVVEVLIVYEQEQMLGEGLRESRRTDKFQKKAEKECCERVSHWHVYDLKTVALTEQQWEKLQVCETSWVRRITKTKMVARRRMNDLRKEIGLQSSLGNQRWEGHVERIQAGKFEKIAEAQKYQECRIRGRLQLRWEVCIRRDMKNIHGET